jgi:hypothetical protein
MYGLVQNQHSSKNWDVPLKSQITIIGWCIDQISYKLASYVMLAAALKQEHHQTSKLTRVTLLCLDGQTAME